MQWLNHPYFGRSVSSISFFILFLHKQAGKFLSRSPYLHHVLISFFRRSAERKSIEPACVGAEPG
jgi:hypothetical protein